MLKLAPHALSVGDAVVARKEDWTVRLTLHREAYTTWYAGALTAIDAGEDLRLSVCFEDGDTRNDVWLENCYYA